MRKLHWRSSTKKATSTRAAFQLNLQRLCVPRVEAVGRYLDLLHDGEPLGFLVLSTLRQERFVNHLQNYLGKIASDECNQTVLSEFVDTCIAHMADLAGGLAELHARGAVHRQPHCSNWYAGKAQVILLADWDTLIRDGQDLESNITNRAIDFGRLLNQYPLLVKTLFPRSSTQKLLATREGKVSSALFAAYGTSTNHFFSFLKKDRKINELPFSDEYDFLVARRWIEHLGKRDVQTTAGARFDMADFNREWTRLEKSAAIR